MWLGCKWITRYLGVLRQLIWIISMALRADGELSSQLPQLPTPVPRGIDFVPQMLALMGMSPRDSKCSVGFIPFLDMIKLLLPQAEDWPSLQRQLKSELFTKLYKREDLSSPFSPREDNLRSGGLYYSFLAINYAIQMPVKASLHAVAGVIKLDTWGQMPLFPDPPTHTPRVKKMKRQQFQRVPHKASDWAENEGSGDSYSV